MPKNENPIMQYFSYEHLPAHLKGVSQILANAAKLLNSQLPDGPEKSTGLRKLLEAKDCFVRQALQAPNAVVAGDLSDGYHSFNELYAHRMQLFAVICNQNAVNAWKSKQHHEKPMYPGYFIVGVDTPMGQFTYHYPMLHWGMFNVRELDKAPEWDGHTADDVVRLHSIKATCFDMSDLNVSDNQIDAVGYAATCLSNENREALLHGTLGKTSHTDTFDFSMRRMFR